MIYVSSVFFFFATQIFINLNVLSEKNCNDFHKYFASYIAKAFEIRQKLVFNNN